MLGVTHEEGNRKWAVRRPLSGGVDHRLASVNTHCASVRTDDLS